MFQGLGTWIIIIVAIAGIFKVMTAMANAGIFSRRKGESAPDRTIVDEYADNTSFKCSNCGAVVPSRTQDGKMNGFCPFCGSKFQEADKLMHLSLEERQKIRSYNMSMAHNENERLRIQQEENAKQKAYSNERLKLILLIIVVIFIMLPIILIVLNTYR